METSDLTVLVSAAGGMKTRGLVDELRAHDVTVVGVDADPYSYGLQYADSGYVVPHGDDPAFVDELLQIVRREDVDAMLCSPESEVLAVSEERQAFENVGCDPLCPDHAVVQQCADKRQTKRFFERHDVPTPETYADAASAETPCIVKPRRGRGSTGIYVATTQQELDVYASQVDVPIFEEYVEGTEYTVDVLAEGDGTVLSVVPRRRHSIESGKSVTGVTVSAPTIRQHCRRIAEALPLRGPACIQCIRTDDGLQFIEVNTRFGGGSVLSMQADDELVPNLLRMIRGDQTTPSEEYTEDLVMLRNYDELFVDNSKIPSDGS